MSEKITLEPPSKKIGHAEFYHHDAGMETRVIKVSARFSHFVYAGVPMNKDSTISWLAFLRSMTREFVLDFFYYVGLPTFAALIVAGGAINSVLAGTIFALFSFCLTFAFTSYRHTRSLPTNLNFAYTTAELPHYRQGLIVWFLWGVLMTGAALVAWPTIPALVTAPVAPNFATGAAGAFSAGGAFVYLVIVTFLIVLSAQHNFTLDLHSYYYKNEADSLMSLTRVNMVVSLVDTAVKAIGWQFGMWLVNPFAYVGACLAAGNCTANGSFGWGVHFFGPIVGGLLAWVVHLWTYNQNGVPTDVYRNAAKQQKAAQMNFMDGAPKNKLNRM